MALSKNAMKVVIATIRARRADHKSFRQRWMRSPVSKSEPKSCKMLPLSRCYVQLACLGEQFVINSRYLYRRGQIN